MGTRKMATISDIFDAVEKQIHIILSKLIGFKIDDYRHVTYTDTCPYKSIADIEGDITKDIDVSYDALWTIFVMQIRLRKLSKNREKRRMGKLKRLSPGKRKGLNVQEKMITSSLRDTGVSVRGLFGIEVPISKTMKDYIKGIIEKGEVVYIRDFHDKFIKKLSDNDYKKLGEKFRSFIEKLYRYYQIRAFNIGKMYEKQEASTNIFKESERERLARYGGSPSPPRKKAKSWWSLW